MSEFWPSLHSLAGAAGLALTLALFFALGLMAKKRAPEIRIAAGWGLAALVLTLWGVATPWDLRIPLGALAVLGIVLLWMNRAGLRGLSSLARLSALSIPLWVVMIGIHPAQIDTWLNLLPNAAYLYDHGQFPTDARPPSYSFLPAAPYNTQLAAFIASVVSGSFADSAMALFSVALQVLSGLIFARVLADGFEGDAPEPLPWWAIAGGFLLAIPLNPGFLPRVFFASYGEAPLAVLNLFAIWLAARMVDGLEQRSTPQLPALALALAAMVNSKQSGIGSVLSIAIALLIELLIHPRVPKKRGLVALVGALAPALLLYGAWRWFVLGQVATGELKPLPMAEWNLALVPEILIGMFHAMALKGVYFAFMLGVLIAAVVIVPREAWNRRALILFMAAATTLLFTGFILFTYIAHFEARTAVEAHSFFRYMTQLSLALMLGAVAALRPIAVRLLARFSPSGRAWLGSGAIGVALFFPLAFANLLRTDLLVPMPQARAMIAAMKPAIAPGDRIAILVPGDRDDSAGSVLRGLLLFTPPRRTPLEIRTETDADAATFASLVAAGYRLALVSCTPADWQGIPPRVAAVVEYGAAGWQPRAIWHWPEDLAHRRFVGVAPAPFCAGK